MILTQQLLYKLDLKLNKKASNEHQSIPLEDKILALNEAQIKLIKQKVGSNNIYGLGLDSFKKRYQDLQKLVVPFERLNSTKTTETHESYYSNIEDLANNYFLPLDIYVLATKDSCTDRPIYINQIVKHGDITFMLNDKTVNPSFNYQDTFAAISNNKIIVYSDGFKVTDLYISYLRYPIKIDFEGYEDFDGNLSTTQNCELEDYLEDELLDLAVLELAMDTENIPAVQFTDIRNKNNE